MPRRRKTTSEFIEQAKKVHGDKYDYSLVEYVKNDTKVKIICPEHGEFSQVPLSHFNQGNGCIKCSRKETKSTTSEFIEKAKKVHGDKYDYSLVDYVYSKSKVKIICQEHGVFEQTSAGHLRGYGCKKCASHQNRISQSFTTEEFVKKAKKVHGDKYDYSLVDYVHSKSKIKIICPEHGVFEQTPDSHNDGNLCKQCGYKKVSKSNQSTTEQFIKKANKIHGDRYDYSLVEYVDSKSKVKIICQEHGVFEQVPSGHLTGYGCIKCSKGGWQFSQWYDIAKKSKHFDSFKVYFIKCYDEDEAFYKIGITYREISTRFYPSTLPYQYEVINTKEVQDINDKEGARMIYDMENRFKRLNSSNKYFPKKEFGGMTECFSSPDGPPGWSRTVLKNNNKIYNTKSIYSEK